VGSGKGTLGVRPEHLGIGEGGEIRVPGAVRLAERLGAETMLYVDTGDGPELAVRTDGLSKAAVGDRLEIAVSRSSCHLFDEQGRAVINGALM
jgi:multiple sugar transport system ATP-binding protein